MVSTVVHACRLFIKRGGYVSDDKAATLNFRNTANAERPRSSYIWRDKTSPPPQISARINLQFWKRLR